jgi:hypothetical protein
MDVAPASQPDTGLAHARAQFFMHCAHVRFHARAKESVFCLQVSADIPIEPRPFKHQKWNWQEAIGAGQPLPICFVKSPASKIYALLCKFRILSCRKECVHVQYCAMSVVSMCEFSVAPSASPCLYGTAAPLLNEGRILSQSEAGRPFPG